MEEKVFVIADIHGQLETLKALLKKIPSGYRIISVGDLIDRGPKSKEVIDFIIDNDIEMVQGNHENYMIRSLVEIDSKNDSLLMSSEWRQPNNGGIDTLMSYSYYTDFEKEKFIKHIKFLKKQPIFKIIEFKKNRPLIISHSSISKFWKGSNLDQYSYIDKYHILTNRYLKDNITFCDLKNIYNGKVLFNIFGHTIIEKVYLSENFAAIDCGAGFKKNLVAIEYPNLNIIYQKVID